MQRVKWHAWWKNAYNISAANLKEREHFGDVGTETKCESMNWTEWLRRGPVAYSYEIGTTYGASSTPRLSEKVSGQIVSSLGGINMTFFWGVGWHFKGACCIICMIA